jgi:Conserved hypothetical protein 698
MDQVPLSEATESKPTVLSRGRGALAAARLNFPGALVSVIIAVATTFLSEHYGGPVMLFALLLGMAFYFLSQEGPCAAGIEFASKRVLRIAVGLLGAQITISEIMKLGPTPVVMVIAAVTLTILFGVVGARVTGISRPFGVLTAGAVAICGASAALAISSVLPKGENHERDTVFTVIGVTALSTMAMIVYPLIIALFHLDHAAIGVFLGGTIHDVAQVVGAGFSVSDETGNVGNVHQALACGDAFARSGDAVVHLSRAQHQQSRAAIAGVPRRFRGAGGGEQSGHHSDASARCAQGHFALVPCHRHRGAWNENVPQGDGGSGRTSDWADRRRDRVRCGSRARDCPVEILRRHKSAAATARRRLNPMTASPRSPSVCAVAWLAQYLNQADASDS